MEAAKPRYQREGRREQQIQYPQLSTGLRLPPGFDPDQNPDASIPYHRLYLNNVAHTLSEDDIRAVFEPFGQIDFIDRHLDHVSSHTVGCLQG
jgi:RNA-binding protein 39